MSSSSAGSMALSMQSHVPAPTPDEIANMVVDLAGLNTVRNRHLLQVFFFELGTRDSSKTRRTFFGSFFNEKFNLKGVMIIV